MTQQEEINALRLVVELQQTALRHFQEYVDEPDAMDAPHHRATAAANASASAKLCTLYEIPRTNKEKAQTQ